MTENETEHRIKWFATGDGRTWIPRSRSLRGTWGFDAECSCGWKSSTGGGVERYVRDLVERHKWDVKHGFAS